ncbi:plasmid segregation protein ParM, partial [Klebsiella pneumoniae]
FIGYSHAFVFGGGAPLVAVGIRERMGLRVDRFVVAEEPQFALVRGLKIIG